MFAALKILTDVLVYRLRRLEMANLVAAVAIMLALRLPWVEVGVRSVFALLLNLLAYLTNDYYDVERDLAGGRDEKKTRFLAEHRPAALGAQFGLAVMLAAIALVHDLGLLLALVGGAGLCWLYSAKLKRTAYFDVLAMALWGATMPLAGVPLGNSTGLWLLGELALFSAAFELIQVARDSDEDRAAGIVTTGVALGARRCLLASRVAMVLAALYAMGVLHRFLGIGVLVAALLPPGDDIPRYWNRVRLTLGIVWLATLAWVASMGGLAGLARFG